MRRKAVPVDKKMYSLTQRQAQWIASARDTDGGMYVSLVDGSEPYELVEAGAAVFREAHHSSGSRGPRDSRPCEWTDIYLVPTERGLELLGRFVGAKP